MIRKLFCPLLLDTGYVSDRLFAIRDGMVNVYVFKTPAGLVSFDAGWRPRVISRAFRSLGLEIQDVTAVFLTHLHWDHAGCLRMFPDADIFVGEMETSLWVTKKMLNGKHAKKLPSGRILSINDLKIRVIHTPGHTPGSVSYFVDDRLLFTGDTLRIKAGRILPFPAWINRDNRKLAQSIRGLAQIDGVDCVLTAHHGITRDIHHAFASWRGAPAGPNGESSVS